MLKQARHCERFVLNLSGKGKEFRLEFVVNQDRPFHSHNTVNSISGQAYTNCAVLFGVIRSLRH